MNRCLIPGLVGLAIVAAAPAFGADAPGDVARGKAAFEHTCAMCHGRDIRPDHMLAGTASLQAKYRGAEPALLEERTDLAASYVMFIIRHGDEAMPFFRPTEVTNQQLHDIAAYLTRNNK